jgi:filamentous hemagglutinin family protein
MAIANLFAKLFGLVQSLNAENFDVTNVKTVTFNQEFNNGNSTATATVDWTKALKQQITINAATATLTFTAPAGVSNLLLRVVQDATGGRLVTWPATVKWAGGAAPTLSTAANAVDVVSFFYNGTNYYGTASLNFA